MKFGDSRGSLNVEDDSAVVEAVEFSKDEKYIASGSAYGKELMVWSASNGENLFSFSFPKKLEIIAFSPDDKYLLAGGEFNYLSVWNTSNWTHYQNIYLPSGVEGMAYPKNGNILAIGREDGVIILLDPKNFTIIDSLLHGFHGSTPDYGNPGYRADVNSLDFSPDGNYLVTGGYDGDIKIWYLPNLKLIKTIQAHSSSIKSVRINNQGNCIASASSGLPYEGDNSIKIWDFNSGELLHKLSSPFGAEAVEFTPCGQFLICGAREFVGANELKKNVGYIYIYYIPDNYLTEAIRLVNKQPAPLSDYFHFNKSGSKMISGHEDGTIRLWNVKYKELN